MEITIVIGMGESLQDVLRRTKLNPVGPMTLTLTSETQKDVVATPKAAPQPKPTGKKRGRPKGSKNKKAKKAKTAKLESILPDESRLDANDRTQSAGTASAVVKRPISGPTSFLNSSSQSPLSPAARENTLSLHSGRRSASRAARAARCASITP